VPVVQQNFSSPQPPSHFGAISWNFDQGLTSNFSSEYLPSATVEQVRSFSV
jgi:hypothetical protein